MKNIEQPTSKSLSRLSYLVPAWNRFNRKDNLAKAGCHGICQPFVHNCLALKPGISVASAPSVAGSVFMRKCRLFLRQCIKFSHIVLRDDFFLFWMAAKCTVYI